MINTDNWNYFEHTLNAHRFVCFCYSLSTMTFVLLVLPTPQAIELFSTTYKLHFQIIIFMFRNLRKALMSDILCNRLFVFSIINRMLNYTHLWFSSICHAKYLNRLMKAKTCIFSICHLTLNGRLIFELFSLFCLKTIKDTFEIIKLIHTT